MKLLIIPLAFFISSFCLAQNGESDYMEREEIILDMVENGLIEWYSGKPATYAEPFAENITYFDPGTEGKRILTSDQLRDLIKNRDTKYDYSELKDPMFQHFGDISILTLNYHQDFKAGVTLHWNSTEVYHKDGDELKRVHAHWSPYSSDIVMLPKLLLFGGGVVLAILFGAIGWFIGKKRKVNTA